LGKEVQLDERRIMNSGEKGGEEREKKPEGESK
jgi:hypothetical protein